ncbi:AAA family ATPase [Gorillibacterium massiliense]|uniref:AAA family ATPase n=1 Tax=Gorillibacterium massiliense TaxID=1280390 RepID=UPI0004B69085|nr:AAA family ATPase [Gorillibacterium massiliense]
MRKILVEVEQWLSKRPRWLQHAAYLLIQNNNTLTEDNYRELVLLCKTEAQLIDTKIKPQSVTAGSLSAKESSLHIRLDAIKSIRGISALSPRNPLKFQSPLSIVYGQNGSGKSSYVRLLKHISGAKKIGKLMGNVYVQEQQPQDCSLVIIKDGTSYEINWAPDQGALNELRTLQLYDTDCANVYVNDENEVAYEPWILLFFSQLTDACLKVGQALKKEMDNITLSKLIPPEGSSNTKAILWLKKIKDTTSSKEIEDNCSWVGTDEITLRSKRQQLAETDPIEKMKQFRNTAQNIKKLQSILTKIRDSLTDESCNKVINALLDYSIKRKAAEEDARNVFEGLSLDGVGSESWKLLWEQARIYSEQLAYPEKLFPYIETGSNCVLCQQPLSPEAQGRLSSFESFVKDSLNKEAIAAESHYNTLLKAINEVPSDETLALHFNSIGITSDKEKQTIIDFCAILKKRSERLNGATSLDQLANLPPVDLLKFFDETAAAKEQQAADYEKSAQSENRDELKKSVIELETRRWLHQNKSVITENVEMLEKIAKYKAAIILTSTQSLSTKKSSLSNELITTEYIKRFQKELQDLGGSRINVELTKTRAERGHIYHQVKLRNCPANIRTSEVLSEGEFRIVSLAGFLADVEVGSNNTPFIFDDPISSLDQLFEEATVKRIARLSLSRQVIVFTHRLSFLTLLEDAANELGIDCNVTWLRAESWGTGEPGDTPVFAKKPEKALNLLLNDRLTRARKVLLEQGRTEYDLIAKGICSDFRILIERFIENDLLGDVVQRFRRSVNTMGKLHKLAYISVEDCKLFEDFMTKYSAYEHSQSYEIPIMLPEPDELQDDMEHIKIWLSDFKKRTTA